MTTFDELHRDILAAFESQVKLNEAQQRLDAVTNEQIERLWTDNAALRDELHAVANRVEGLVRAVTANPADVAAKIVNEANRATLREVRGKASAQSAAAPGKRQGCTPPGRSAKAPERGSHD